MGSNNALGTNQYGLATRHGASILFPAWMLSFDVYQRSSCFTNEDYEAKFGKGGVTLLSLLESLPECVMQLPLRLYFDNYCRCLPLVAHLSTMEYGATGTLRNVRITKKWPINSNK